MPAWRFVLAPGAVTEGAWAGLMVPSVDAVGRCFPLTVAAALPATSADLAGSLFAATGWFGDIEAIALRAIAPRASIAEIDAALKAQPFRAESPRSLAARLPSEIHATAARLAKPGSAWLAEESEVLGRSLLVCERLPGEEQFCAMMDGRWAAHGWTRHALEAA
jgi:type VI secretion system protein ImpM